MECYLLIIQDHFVVDVSLNNGSGSPYAIGYLNCGGGISLLQVFLCMFLIGALSTCRVLVIADVDNLKDKELSLDLGYLVE